MCNYWICAKCNRRKHVTMPSWFQYIEIWKGLTYDTMWCDSSSTGKPQPEHRKQHKPASLCIVLLGWLHCSYQKHNLHRICQEGQLNGILQRHCGNQAQIKVDKYSMFTVHCQSYADVCELVKRIRKCVPALEKLTYGIWLAWSQCWWWYRVVGGEHRWNVAAGLVNIFCRPIVSHYSTTVHQLASGQHAVISLVVVTCSWP